MARKLEEVLRAKGYSDTDLEALKTLLADSRFRESLEGELGAVETERDTFKGEAAKFRGESESWAGWYKDTGLPTVEKALKDAQDARAQAASHEARLKILQEQGLIKLAGGDADPNPNPKPDPAQFDPKAHNLVTLDDVHKFADAEGDAIAMASDLAAEHQSLFGKPLTGLRELRREALASKRPIYDYVTEKLKFATKRQEISDAALAAREAEIRKDERSKAIAEIANPNARPPADSRFTLLPRPTADGKQPWDNFDDRMGARVNKALQHILTG